MRAPDAGVAGWLDVKQGAEPIFKVMEYGRRLVKNKDGTVRVELHTANGGFLLHMAPDGDEDGVEEDEEEGGQTMVRDGCCILETIWGSAGPCSYYHSNVGRTVITTQCTTEAHYMLGGEPLGFAVGKFWVVAMQGDAEETWEVTLAAAAQEDAQVPLPLRHCTELVITDMVLLPEGS